MILPVVRNEDDKEMWIALQSLPFGSGRNNVGIYYKELANEKALLQEEYRLANQNKSYTTTKGSSSGSSASKSSSSSGSTFSTTTTSSTPKTTNESILALGYGPISAAKLNELVASGVVEEYKNSNGVTMFRKATKKSNALTKYLK